MLLSIINCNIQHGLRELKKPSSAPVTTVPRKVEEPPEPPSQPASQRKRKADEIADSEDEGDSDGEYGWIEGDDAELLENPTEKS